MLVTGPLDASAGVGLRRSADCYRGRGRGEYFAMKWNDYE